MTEVDGRLDGARGVRLYWRGHLPPGEPRGVLLVCHGLGEHAGRIAEYAAMGFDRIFLHHVGQDQTRWVPAFGEHVLPQLGVTAPEQP